MANTENNPVVDTSTGETETSTPPAAVVEVGIPEPAKSFITDYMKGLKKTAKEYKDAADVAKTTSERNLAGKERHFNKAEDSVDVYENILNMSVNLLAKTMEKVALEIDGNVAKAAEITKLLATANAAIQASKDKLAAADVAAENLCDIVRRDLSSDPNVIKLREKMAENGLNFDTVVKDYAVKIQDASDSMNKALVVIKEIKGTISADKLKQLAQSTKAKTDAYKTDIIANLEFSKEKLKKTHADFIAASAAAGEAQYNVDAGDNGEKALVELEKLIVGT